MKAEGNHLRSLTQIISNHQAGKDLSLRGGIFFHPVWRKNSMFKDTDIERFCFIYDNCSSTKDERPGSLLCYISLMLLH